MTDAVTKEIIDDIRCDEVEAHRRGEAGGNKNKQELYLNETKGDLSM